MSCNDLIINEIILQDNNEPVRQDNNVLCRVVENGIEKVIFIDEALLLASQNLNASEENLQSVGDAPKENIAEIDGKENKAEWDDNDSVLLLDLYHQCLPLVGPLKKFRTKKAMWVFISNEINTRLNKTRTPMQCESRYKTILKRKTGAIKNNRTSGETQEVVKFQAEIEKIKAQDDSLEPEILISGNTLRVAKKSPPVLRKTKKPKSELIEFFKEAHKEKEENKERRHKEKMELLKNLVKIGHNPDSPK